MKEFHWETPVPEKHHNYNFDVRKVSARLACHSAPAARGQG